MGYYQFTNPTLRRTITNCTFNGLPGQSLAGRSGPMFLVSDALAPAYPSDFKRRRPIPECALCVLLKGYDMQGISNTKWGSQESIDRCIWLNLEMYLHDAKAYLKHRIDVRDLPSVPIDRPDFADNLPSIPAVYFICQPPRRKAIYIGRTSTLRARWSLGMIRQGTVRDPDLDHHRLKAALKLRNAHLLWIRVPPDYLGIVEMMLIQIHKPRWNVVRR